MENKKYNHFKSNDFILDDEFRAWLAGSTPEKDHLWEDWLMRNPAARIEVDRARTIISALKFKEKNTSARDVDREWHKLEAAVSQIEPTAIESEHPSKNRFFPFLKTLVAASALLILGFFGHRIWNGLRNDVALNQAVKQTVDGQQLMFKLPDGTSVVLNGGSTLSYPLKFDDTLREISLEGEAFFSVVKNEKAPFIIHSGGVTTKVLGTSFNVRAYPETKEVQVAVVEGKVKVNANTGGAKNSVCLVKSEMVTVKQDQGELVVSAYDERDLIGWKDGILYFEKADFNSAMRKLERWYGVKILLADQRKMNPSWRFSGKFKNKSLDYILGVMSYPNQFSYKINANTVNLE